LLVEEAEHGTGEGGGIKAGDWTAPESFFMAIGDAGLAGVVFKGRAKEDFAVSVAVCEPVFLRVGRPAEFGGG
jgi:hypothetical protein